MLKFSTQNPEVCYYVLSIMLLSYHEHCYTEFHVSVPLLALVMNPYIYVYCVCVYACARVCECMRLCVFMYMYITVVECSSLLQNSVDVQFEVGVPCIISTGYLRSLSPNYSVVYLSGRFRFNPSSSLTAPSDTLFGFSSVHSYYVSGLSMTFSLPSS